MTLGIPIRYLIRNFISDRNVRSSLTLNPITVTSGDKGGYEVISEATGTSKTIYAIPEDYVKNRLSQLKIGEFLTGDINFLVRDDESIGEDDEITFDGNDYQIKEIRPVYFNEVTVAQAISLKRKLS